MPRKRKTETGAKEPLKKIKPVPPQEENSNPQNAEIGSQPGSSTQNTHVLLHTIHYNPNIRKTLDLSLMHDLDHDLEQENQRNVVFSVKFSLDGRYLATGSYKQVRIYDIETGQLIRLLKDNDVKEYWPIDMEHIRSLCFSPDRKYLIAAGEDLIIRIWNIQTGTYKKLEYHDQPILSVDVHPNPSTELFVSASVDGKVVVTDYDDLSLRYVKHAPESSEFLSAVWRKPDGKYLACGGSDSMIRIINHSGQHAVWKAHGDRVCTLAWSQSGNTLASGSFDKSVKLWDVSSHDFDEIPKERLPPCKTLEGHKDLVLGVDFTHDDHWLVSGSRDTSVLFWDGQSGVPQFQLQAHNNSVLSVACSPVDHIFATGSGDRHAKIWKFSELSESEL